MWSDCNYLVGSSCDLSTVRGAVQLNDTLPHMMLNSSAVRYFDMICCCLSITNYPLVLEDSTTRNTCYRRKLTSCRQASKSGLPAIRSYRTIPLFTSCSKSLKPKGQLNFETNIGHTPHLFLLCVYCCYGMFCAYVFKTCFHRGKHVETQISHKRS